jgi:hypothetical protein
MRDRYTLVAALRIVRDMETMPTRGAVFEEIKNKNRLYRLVDNLYSGAGAVQQLVLFAYMMKCVVSIGAETLGDDAEAVAISNFGNECHTIDRLAALVPTVRLLRLSLKRRHALRLGQIRQSFRMLGSARRVWPFLSQLVRSHSFMPAARIASALAFYIRFLQLFSDRPKLAAAMVASNYSPEALGLAAAAHKTGRRVIYMNHAPVPANGLVLPPVLADCAIFYGNAATKAYKRRSRCSAEVAVIGQPWPSRPMEWRDKVKTVGIFLTSLTNADVVAGLVAAIKASRPEVRILVRNHPVALLKSDYSDLVARHDNLTVTYGNPLDEEIAACDLIICGNSSVALNAVSAGRPVGYMDTLDGSDFDYNGFVESELICHVTGWSDEIYRQLRGFYDRDDWQAVMRTYDASYQTDGDRLKQAAADMILRYVRPMTGTTFDKSYRVSNAR